MGAGGLVVDLQRVYGVHGQMQAFVDDAALAGAAELDGATGSITRSARAACGTQCGIANGPLITGPAKSAPFATDTTLAVKKITFLSALGTDPAPLSSTPAAGDMVLCTYEVGTGWTDAGCDIDADNVESARFIEVLAEPRTVSYMVLPILDAVGQLMGAAPITSQATLQLRATAGFKAQVCDITPLMVCNPSEPEMNEDEKFPFNAIAGQQILMKTKGNGAAWVPGDFGLVQVPDEAGGHIKCTGGGAQAIQCMLGLVDPLTQCIGDEGIDIQPGEANSVANGLNARFDIYEGSMKQNRTSADFAPSVNVIKGICKITGSGGGAQCNYGGGGGGPGGNACPNMTGNDNGNGGFASAADLPSSPTDKRSMPLPRDSDISQVNRFGNGDWDRTTYWTRNHGGTLPGSLATATRYEVYRYEIANNLHGAKSGVGGEDGRPQCSTQPGINNPSRDRRVLTMAVVNCYASGINGSANDVHPVAYAQMFLTEPVGLSIDVDGNYDPSSNTSDYYAEVVGVVKPNDQSGVYHVQPILYR
jgi:hypothetical protein